MLKSVGGAASIAPPPAGVTQDSGVFPANVDGLVGSQQVNLTWVRTGQLMTVVVPTFSGVSDEDFLHFTNIPGFMLSAQGELQFPIAAILNGGTVTFGNAQIRVRDSNPWRFSINGGDFAFNDTGNKGNPTAFAVTYLVTPP